jgi:hypothetical protein
MSPDAAMVFVIVDMIFCVGIQDRRRSRPTRDYSGMTAVHGLKVSSSLRRRTL